MTHLLKSYCECMGTKLKEVICILLVMNTHEPQKNKEPLTEIHSPKDWCHC